MAKRKYLKTLRFAESYAAAFKGSKTWKAFTQKCRKLADRRGRA